MLTSVCAMQPTPRGKTCTDKMKMRRCRNVMNSPPGASIGLSGCKYTDRGLLKEGFGIEIGSVRHQQFCHMHLKQQKQQRQQQQQQPIRWNVSEALSVSCFLFCFLYLTPARCSVKRLPSIWVSKVQASSPLEQQLCSLDVAVCCGDVELQGRRRNKESFFLCSRLAIDYAVCIKYRVLGPWSDPMYN